jgi:hypothetical protein
MPKRIKLSRAQGWRLPPRTIKVDRTTRFGNPYRINERIDMKQVRRWGWEISPAGRECVCHSSAEAVARFRHALLWDAAIHDFVRNELGGKDLACWCDLDQPCHADVLIEIANSDAADIRAVHEEEDRKIMDEAALVLHRLAAIKMSHAASEDQKP